MLLIRLLGRNIFSHVERDIKITRMNGSFTDKMLGKWQNEVKHNLKIF